MSDNQGRLLEREPTAADLTICICTIGRDGYLQTAIKTLLDTTPPGVTLRVVLNGPDDPGLANQIADLIESWDGPTDISTLPARLTISGSHNTALQATTTDFVSFMGDDDLALEPRVARLLRLFWTTTPTPAVIGSYCRRVSGTHDEPKFSTNKDYGPATVEAWRATVEAGDLIEVVFPSAIYRTELLRSIGGFEERFGSAMDLATFTRLGFDHPVLADPRRSFAHRVHDGSVTSSNAAHHAARLRYTEACMTARRERLNEPSWEDFLEAENALPTVQRLTNRRRTLSATLFRQGGAAVASGRRLAGLTKVAASALTSPTTFLERTGSHVSRDVAGQPVVSILIKNTNHYRVPFYEALRAALREHDVELRLIVAEGLGEDRAKGDRATLTWAEIRPLREVSISGRTLLWQPGFDIASGSELVITEQASKQLFNIVLAHGQRVLRTRHAFWGHGKNFQAPIEGTSGEGLKKRLTERAHWFFAYNEVSAKAAIDAGMPSERVTAVMNATDTNHIRQVLDALPSDTSNSVRAELGMGNGPVGVFMGGIYPPKRTAFLLEAAHEIRRLVSDFELLVIGGGSERALVDAEASAFPWIHSVGPEYGDARIRLASVAELQLMPGMVGLNIVDAFALGLPTITTDIDYHSPEIDYLIDGQSGVMIHGDPSPAAYAAGVVEVLQNDDLLGSLQHGAHTTGLGLTIESMASLFCDGVLAALDAPLRS